MRRKRAVVMLEAMFVLCGLASFLAGAIIRPRSVQMAWIRLAAGSRWEKLNELGRLVEPGMTADDVRRILGEPTREEAEPTGERWVYHDGESCAGAELWVRFTRCSPGGAPLLSEVRQGSMARHFGPPNRAYCEKYYHIVSPRVASRQRY